jgi:hypothetical protein
MFGIPVEMLYPIFALFLFGLAIIFIPRDKFKDLFWVSLIWGYMFSILSAFLGREFGLFEWRRIFPFEFLGSVQWLDFAWIFAVMLFLYYIPESKGWYIYPSYLTIFSVASAAIDMIFHELDLLAYINWNPFCRFGLALFWFYGATVHHRYQLKQDEDPTK